MPCRAWWVVVLAAVSGCHLVLPHDPEPPRVDLGKAQDLRGARDLGEDADAPVAGDAARLGEPASCNEPAEILATGSCGGQSVDDPAADGDRDGLLDALDPDRDNCNWLRASEELATPAHPGVSATGAVDFLCGEARMAEGSTLDVTPGFLKGVLTGKIIVEVRFAVTPQPTPWSVAIAVTQQDGTTLTCTSRQYSDGDVGIVVDGCGTGPTVSKRLGPAANDHRLRLYNDGWLVGCQVLRDGLPLGELFVNCAALPPSAISFAVSGANITVDHLRVFEKK